MLMQKKLMDNFELIFIFDYINLKWDNAQLLLVNESSLSKTAF